MIAFVPMCYVCGYPHAMPLKQMPSPDLTCNIFSCVSLPREQVPPGNAHCNTCPPALQANAAEERAVWSHRLSMMEKELSSTKTQILALMQHLTAISPISHSHEKPLGPGHLNSSSSRASASSSSSSQSRDSPCPAAAASKDALSSKTSKFQTGSGQEKGAVKLYLMATAERWSVLLSTTWTLHVLGQSINRAPFRHMLP